MNGAPRIGGHRLRRRLATALVALTALSAFILSLVFLGMERYVEDTTIGGFDSIAKRERLLVVALLGTFLIIALVAVWVSARLARQTLSPLDALVASLHALDPELRGQRLPALERDSELAVIADALNAYMQRLDELVERERAFAAAASHELRTPLAVIRGAAEVLEASTPSKALARIQRAAQHAQHDLDALLWLSRAGEAPAAETLMLHEQLKSLCAAQIDTEAVLWHLQPATVVAPRGAVSIIVSNLLRNALRAAPQPGGVRVQLNDTGLTVEDDGPGVPPDELPQVFAPRTRGHDGGTGMGLYIAATLATRLGWTLSLENRASGGARACLRFS